MRDLAITAIENPIYVVTITAMIFAAIQLLKTKEEKNAKSNQRTD